PSASGSPVIRITSTSERIRALLITPTVAGRPIFLPASGSCGEIFLLSRLYYNEWHEPLLLREVLLSTDHYLTYELNLEWERRVQEGLL
ncbi:MAG: hypothetical protein ACRD1R_12545, partial [Acidobacteriota bacterium]